MKKITNQIMFDDIIISQVEDKKIGILFFISEISYQDFNKLLNKNPMWHVVSIVSYDD